MRFPDNYPDFSMSARRRLSELGVGSEQLTQLRLSLKTIQLFALPTSYAPKAEIACILDEVEELSRSLATKLNALVSMPTAAYGAAFSLLEEGYWQSRPDDEGPTSSSHLTPRLVALGEAARFGRESLPAQQSRPRLADPRPIKRIEQALMQGWLNAKGSRVRTTPDNETLEQALASARENPPLGPYPSAFIPSKNGAFREIVGICYAAVGANSDPLRAIEGHLKLRNECRRRSLAALENGLRSATKKKGSKRLTTTTSPKD